MAQEQKFAVDGGQRHSHKRKGPLVDTNTDGRPAQKKLRLDKITASRDARNIIAQTSFKAFDHGELDVDKFIKSREYEIRALEQGLVNSKKALSKRAFQLVPKELRRRTASHNAKRVPKKLQKRAKREMREDNTPTVTARRRRLSSHMRLRMETAKRLRSLGAGRKAPMTDRATVPPTPEKSNTVIRARPARVKHAKLMEPLLPKARFRKRQKDKTWLPTHLYHAKRARMTPPKEPLWRFALPMTPTAKSYRSTHRAASERGAIAFDMSYVSTIMLSGQYSSLMGALESLDVEQSIRKIRMPRRLSWLRGEVVSELQLYRRDDAHALIAPATVIWSRAATSSATWDTLEAANGSLFVRVHPSAFLILWEELLRVSKVVKPAISVEDLRYEIGSIDVVGPSSTEALLSTLQACSVAEQDAIQQLSGLITTALVPPGTIAALEVKDPRLCPKTRLRKTTPQQSIIQRVATWRLPVTPSVNALFDRRNRMLASSSLPSQKAINRRRTNAVPGEDPVALDRDPRIPIMLHTAAKVSLSGFLSKWTVLVPWKCVLPVWYALMYVPLSTGVQPRLGGLIEARNLALEHGVPWFPADFPASRAGWQWELQERKRLRAEWYAQPKSKRVNWQRLDLNNGSTGEIGQGWACDWSRLSVVACTSGQHAASTPDEPSDDGITEEFPSLTHISNTTSDTLGNIGRRALVQVRIEQLSRGVSQSCARIYRLPIRKEERKLWLALHPKHGLQRKDKSRSSIKPPPDAPAHLIQKELARSLLQAPKAGQTGWPPCPQEVDLIGFVTSGNFDLGAGRGTAIGSILAQAVVKDSTTSTIPQEEVNLCIVRNSGQAIGRLARFNLV